MILKIWIYHMNAGECDLGCRIQPENPWTLTGSFRIVLLFSASIVWNSVIVGQRPFYKTFCASVTKMGTKSPALENKYQRYMFDNKFAAPYTSTFIIWSSCPSNFGSLPCVLGVKSESVVSVMEMVWLSVATALFTLHDGRLTVVTGLFVLTASPSPTRTMIVSGTIAYWRH